ncbi:MAG TPA: PepSY domain-containing protein [Candidatus Competibacter sp.]|nr:PepSY domain-containing protein [Candidatus Competibacter sp.]
MNERIAFSAAAVLAVVTTFAGAAFATESQDATPAASHQPAAATATHEITKEQATEMALKAHPGKVTKAYEDTKKGKKTWEIKIDGDDGKKWEVYYEIKTGKLVAEEAD